MSLTQNHASRRGARGFSLIELVIVVVIIAIIAAIAIPRMSRGSAGAQDSALTSDLRILRSALELYATEHGGTYPAVADVVNALTQYSNDTGTVFNAAKDAATGRIYGPYLRDVPPLPVNAPRKGSKGIAAADAAGIGWIYTVNASGVGEIKANTTTEADAKGVLYNTY
jgi:general secretion pathway protein G